MPSRAGSPLATIETRLRWLLPADLYAAAWVDPSAATLTRVFEHLRTLQRSLQDYLPRLVPVMSIAPGEMQHAWQEGSLMFTDLAGFTPLIEANMALGRAGAAALLQLLSRYFAAMIEIISKSGGNLLEFTGDALLAIFPADRRRSDTARAIRAGLRMQRAMAQFAAIDTPRGPLALGMRVGIHSGRFLSANIGTPRRMEYVLLGADVQRTKLAEGAGQVGRVCLTPEAQALVYDGFRCEGGEAGHVLVVDDFSAELLGEYDIAPAGRRASNPMLLDRSVEGLVGAIEEALSMAEPLASYFPQPILNLLVESTARRKIKLEFPALTVVFVNLIGLSQAVDRARPGEEHEIVTAISRIFALINAAVEARGGVLKNVTYEHSGSDILIYFGAPNGHIDDPLRAADAALTIRDIVAPMPPLRAGGEDLPVICQIGVALGPAFAAEIGELRGRREFNVLGDTVNTAARIMNRAEANKILITAEVHQAIRQQFGCAAYGTIALKGKSAPLPLFTLDGRQG
ncbi:MAG: adenylate/guanylate cyclase domain-containing protein [Roseiflexaceae bacterium]